MPSPKPRRVVPSDDDIKIGIMLGLGWKPGKIAEEMDRGYDAIHAKIRGAKAAFIASVEAWTKAYASREIAAKLAAADIKSRIARKGYEVIEKSVNHALQEDVKEVTPTHIAAVKEGLDRVEGKALDRKSILSEHTEHVEVTHKVDGAGLDAIMEEVRQINELRRKALPPPADVIEAQVIDSATVTN